MIPVDYDSHNDMKFFRTVYFSLTKLQFPTAYDSSPRAAAELLKFECVRWF
jgi:hypothetical protein